MSTFLPSTKARLAAKPCRTTRTRCGGGKVPVRVQRNVAVAPAWAPSSTSSSRRIGPSPSPASSMHLPRATPSTVGQQWNAGSPGAWSRARVDAVTSRRRPRRAVDGLVPSKAGHGRRDRSTCRRGARSTRPARARGSFQRCLHRHRAATVAGAVLSPAHHEDHEPGGSGTGRYLAPAAVMGATNSASPSRNMSSTSCRVGQAAHRVAVSPPWRPHQRCTRRGGLMGQRVQVRKQAVAQVESRPR